MSGYAESSGPAVEPATDGEACDFLDSISVLPGQSVRVRFGDMLTYEPLIEIVRLAITYGKSGYAAKMMGLVK